MPDDTDPNARDGAPSAQPAALDAPSPSGAHMILNDGRVVRVEDYDGDTPKPAATSGVLVNLREGKITIPATVLLSIIAGVVGAGGVGAFGEFNRADTHEQYITDREFSEWKHELDLTQFRMQDDIDDMQDDMDALVEDIKVILITVEKLKDNQ